MSYDLSVPASLIAERMGLNFPEDRWPDLVKGLEKTAQCLGLESSHALVARLLSHSFGQREVQALAALVERTMRLQCTIQDGVAWLGDDRQHLELRPKILFAGDLA